MKKVKIFGILGMLLVMLCTSFHLVSCSSGGGSGSGVLNSIVVGSWSETERDSYGYYTITLNFKSNGTGTLIETEVSSYGSGKYTDTQPFTYQMTSDTEGMIISKHENSYSGYHTHVYEFEIVGKKMYVYDIDDSYGRRDLEAILDKD